MASTFICLKHEAFPQNRIYRVTAVVHCHSATFESRDRSENEHDFPIREASIHQKKSVCGCLNVPRNRSSPIIQYVFSFPQPTQKTHFNK